MEKRSKKTPSDYGLMAFRVTKDKQAELEKRIDKLKGSLNRKLTDNQRLWRKNEIIVTALERGLKYLEGK